MQTVGALEQTVTLDARGLLVRQRRGALERVVLVNQRKLESAWKWGCYPLVPEVFLAASRLDFAASPLNSVAPNEKKTSGTQGNKPLER